MVDFIEVDVIRQTSNNRKSDFIIQPDFILYGVKDIVCKGGVMEAFWYDGNWQSERDLLFGIIDRMLFEKRDELKQRYPDSIFSVRSMRSLNSNSVKKFEEYEKLKTQDSTIFNTKILFSDDEIKREDYSTTQLSYTPVQGPTPAFNAMYSLLYDDDELKKILWFIGATLTNEMVNIEKFLYLYGSKGSGKGTMIKLIEMLFEGYYDAINLNVLTGNSEFATGQIKEIPVLLDSDADIRSIKNDTDLLKMTAHETIVVNRKYREPYPVRFTGLLVAASNQPYSVRNIDSGIMRRAVVARPTGNKHDHKTYVQLMNQIKFELPQVAYKAIQLFYSMGPGYYEDYVDEAMIEETNIVHSFIIDYHQQFGEPATLKNVSELYKAFLEDLGLDTTGYKRKIKQELMRYYKHFYKVKKIGDTTFRNVYSEFKYEFVNIEANEEIGEKDANPLELFDQPSVFDEIAKDYPAQLTTKDGIPLRKWDNVTTTLKDIPTDELHYVQLPQSHIIIDFDLKNEDGEKDLVRNINNAAKFPPTYAELSKSGKGVHLHYYYDGDVSRLATLYDDDIEIKVFTGKQALRRKLTICNDKDISHITTGLPQKKESANVYRDVQVITWNEKKMRNTVKRSLQKQYHANTKPSMDLIASVFDEALKTGVKYDLRDLREDINMFALSSTNQAEKCLKIANSITYTNMDNEEDSRELQKSPHIYDDKDIWFFDIEVFPNLFVVSYKKNGDPDSMVSLVNPDQKDIEALLEKPLIGFNNRRYDNHILYAALLGENNQSLYRQSQRIIDKKGFSGFYSGAYELSYADIYEYSIDKKSLKKWQVELGIHHDEIEIPWDQPVPEHLWERVVEYCENDVNATEEVFKATYDDYTARLIMSNLSGLKVNAKTNQHSAAFIFGGDKRPQDKFIYTDLSEMFPGYEYSFGKSTYKDDDPSEGGYVYAEPGIYEDVAVLDVASMHPHSLIAMNYFGPYTDRFKDIVDLRLDIKHRDFEYARNRFGGELKPYLEDESTADALSLALKITINSVYGMTSAKFDNPFKHKDNVDNIVAKRGALFMIDLRIAVQEKGYTVVHIKTDSIKIANADQDIIDFVMEFGKKYDYTFEHEVTYDVMALIDKAQFIAFNPDRDRWEPTGAIFKDPYIYKKLFSREVIRDEDFAIISEVKDAAIYLGDKHIGRLANAYASVTGYEMKRVNDEGKESSVTGTKGFKWRLFEEYKGKEDIDMSYYETKAAALNEKLEKLGDTSKIFAENEELVVA